MKCGFPIVADPSRASHKVIKRYGVYLVDKRGVIRVYFEGTKTARPRLDLILAELARIQGVKPPKIENVGGKIVVERPAPAPPARQSGRKKYPRTKPEVLDVRWMWSHDKVRPGDELKLAFCPVIAGGYHVYAPWEEKLTPFKVEFRFPAGLEMQGKVTYPKAEVMADPVLKMKLKVYEKDIPLSTIRLKATGDLRPGDRTVTATITFQACGHGTCLPPSTIVKKLPLSIVPAGRKRHQVYGWKSW